MKGTYITPQAEVVTFAPSKAIALEQPGWGWEEDVFSTPETRMIDNEDAERSGTYEG